MSQCAPFDARSLFGDAPILAALDDLRAEVRSLREEIAAPKSSTILTGVDVLEQYRRLNHASALAAQAECCCEMKELIREEAGKTRDLVNSLETHRLAVELVDAKQEILLLRTGVRS